MELWMLRGRSWTRGLYIVARRTSPACLLTYFVAGAVSIADPKGHRAKSSKDLHTPVSSVVSAGTHVMRRWIVQEPPATMSLTCTKRLRKEMHKLRTSPPDEDIALHADDDDIRKWTAHIRGPPDTPYEGGVYELKIAVSSSYPMVPPSMYFATKVFHPNVHFNTGEICLNILKKEWSPAWSLQGACRAILALLAHPEADSPLNCDAGNMVRAGDVRAFRSVARLYKEELASKEWPPK